MKEYINDEVLKILPVDLRPYCMSGRDPQRPVREIRMRVGKPVYFDDRMSDFIAGQSHLSETMEYSSRYSLYAFEESLKEGYITIRGGHRVGVAGQVNCHGKEIHTLKHITCVNIRIAHAVKGGAEELLPYLLQEGGEPGSVLILSGPGGGKTTLLRELIRLLASGTRYSAAKTVGVVDERSEIAASYLGIPEHDLGFKCDVLDCCPKPAGMNWLLRSMAPEVIAVDELGTPEDVAALHEVVFAGCRVIATAHSQSIDEWKRRASMLPLFNDRIFYRYIILDSHKPGKITGIYDEEGRLCTNC